MSARGVLVRAGEVHVPLLASVVAVLLLPADGGAEVREPDWTESPSLAGRGMGVRSADALSLLPLSLSTLLPRADVPTPAFFTDRSKGSLEAACNMATDRAVDREGGREGGNEGGNEVTGVALASTRGREEGPQRRGRGGRGGSGEWGCAP